MGAVSAGPLFGFVLLAVVVLAFVGGALYCDRLDRRDDG